MATTAAMDVLARAADAAELLPYESDDALPVDFFGLEEGLVGGFYFTATDAISGQVQFPTRDAWIAFAGFDHLTASPPTAANPVVASVLASRMRFLELFVRLSMTRECDWQTRLDHRTPLADLTRFAWRAALSRLMGDEWHRPTAQKVLASLRWSHPRFLIEWHHDPIPNDFPAMLEQLLGGVNGDNEVLWNDQPELREVLELHKQPSDDRGLKPAMRHRVVEIGLSFHHGRVTTSLLFSVLEVLERFGEAQRKKHALALKNRARVSVEFRLTALMFDGMTTIAGSALENLADLVRNSHHLRIETIKLPRLVDVEDRCLQHCLVDFVSNGAPVVATRLSCHNDVKSFAAFGSAMRQDTSIPELSMAYVAEDMDALAAWLAFGLFHVDSQSQVSSLCLRMPGLQATEESMPPHAILTPQWMAIFKRVLNCVASAEDLAPIEPKTAKSLKRKRDPAKDSESPLDEVPLPNDHIVLVQVKADTKARKQPLLRSPIVAVIGGEESDQDEEETTPPTDYQVIRKLRGWLAVVVPGAGAGWIPVDAATSERYEKSRIGSDAAVVETHRQVKSFAFVGGALPAAEELRQQHTDILMELLDIVGEPLEALHLPFLRLSNDHVGRIMRSCPNLKELNLFANVITDVAPLVSAYENGICKITALNVAQDGEAHDRVVKQITQILDMGADHPTNCTSIERLAIRLTPFFFDRVDYYLTDVFPQIHAAMFKAPKLEYVRIHCADEDQHHLARELEMLRHRTRATLGSQTTDEAYLSARRSVSLPLRVKLALLSVVRSTSLQDSALGSFDSGIVSLIYEFACTSQLRLVHLAPDGPIF